MPIWLGGSKISRPCCYPKGVAMDPEKIEAMMSWPSPKNRKAVRGFPGLIGYYRKFIKKYGELPRPLTQLLKKDVFGWSPLAEDSFEELKKAMTRAPVWALPDFSKGFVIECDACGSGIGAVLMQERCPIVYFSQALQGRNLQLSTYEKEMLALVIAVQKWRPYLLGSHFIIRTDHQTTTDSRNGWLNCLVMIFPSSIRRAWKMQQQMHFQEWLNMKSWLEENTAAEALSRRVEYGDLAAMSHPIPHWLEPIQEEVTSNPQLQELVKKIEANEAVGAWEYKGGLILFKKRIYLAADSPLIPIVIKEYHCSTHEGFHKNTPQDMIGFLLGGYARYYPEFYSRV